MATQDETRWLINTIIAEWPTTGSLGDTHPPANVVFRNRDDGTEFYYEPGVGDPDAPTDYEAEFNETAAPTDGFRTVGVSFGATTNDFYGNKPQLDVETTLDVRVAEKSDFESGTASDAADHRTLVEFVKQAINTQLTYPDVDPDAEDIGRTQYLDALITDEDSLMSDNQDWFQTDFTVRLRGREDTPTQ